MNQNWRVCKHEGFGNYKVQFEWLGIWWNDRDEYLGIIKFSTKERALKYIAERKDQARKSKFGWTCQGEI